MHDDTISTIGVAYSIFCQLFDALHNTPTFKVSYHTGVQYDGTMSIRYTSHGGPFIISDCSKICSHTIRAVEQPTLMIGVRDYIPLQSYSKYKQIQHFTSSTIYEEWSFHHDTLPITYILTKQSTNVNKQMAMSTTPTFHIILRSIDSTFVKDMFGLHIRDTSHSLSTLTLKFKNNKSNK